MNPLQNDSSGALKNGRVAAVQMVSTSHIDENLHAARTLIDESVAQGAEPVSYTHLDVYKRQIIR